MASLRISNFIILLTHFLRTETYRNLKKKFGNEINRFSKRNLKGTAST